MDLVNKLDKEIEELKQKEAEAKVEADALKEPADPVDPEIEEVEKEEAAEGEQEPAKSDGEFIEPEPVNPARTRITAKKEAQRLAAELEQARNREQELALENARLKGAVEATNKPEPRAEPVQDPEPEYDEFNLRPWLEWKDRQNQNKLAAVQNEFSSFKQTVAQTQAESAWQDLNKNWQEADEVYANSYGFVKSKLEEIVKAKYPTATPAQIKQIMKQEENLFVGQQAQKGVDVRAAFKMLAIESGYNPFEKATEAPRKSVDKTIPNLAAIAEAKKKSGSFMGTSGTSGSHKKNGAKDIAGATLRELDNFSMEDFRNAVKEAKEMGERGELLRS